MLVLHARVDMRAGYPVNPPLWSLRLESAPTCQTEVSLPLEFAQMMDSTD